MRRLRWSLVLLPVAVAETAVAAPPVALRVESFTVPPSTQPLMHVRIKNLLDVPYQGSLSVSGPDGWQIAPAKRDVSLQPGEVKRVPFTVEQGRNVASNSYAVEATVVGGGAAVVRRQDVVVASAPYFKPTIDGDPAEWKDAIPVTFTSGGKKTVVSTYWNRRQFSILVAVEEEKLLRPDEAQVFDAVQLAVAAGGAVTPTSPEDEATRFEFLLLAAEDGQGKCFQLAAPGMKLAEAAKPRALGPLAYDDAEVALSRSGGVTYYECSLSFRPMRDEIRPSEGREFCLSVLVHDPDGTGVRDWGEAAGLWPCQRNPLAWSRWIGAKWSETPPLDSKTEWGLCSSQY